MVHSFLEGNIKRATKLQLDTLELTASLFCEVSPMPVKAACNMMGFDVGIPRLPLIEMSDSGKERLRKAMIDYGIKLK